MSTPTPAQPVVVAAPVAAPPVPAQPPASAPINARTYALPLSQISGLPADAPPGTVFDLWVAWDPRLTKQPRIQKLLTNLTVQKIVPPGGRETEPVVLVSVAARDVVDLLWGHRYGALSAVLLPGA